MEDMIAMMVASALVNGLVTFGMVKAALHFLAEGVREAKAGVAHAHRRIDGILMERRK